MEEILHQLIGRLSHCLQGFIHPRWCRISSINSMSIKLRVGEEDQRGWEGHPKADLWYVCVERTPRKRRWNPFFWRFGRRVFSVQRDGFSGFHVGFGLGTSVDAKSGDRWSPAAYTNEPPWNSRDILRINKKSPVFWCISSVSVTTRLAQFHTLPTKSLFQFSDHCSKLVKELKGLLKPKKI